MLKIKDLEMLDNIDIVYKDKIFLYGAGDLGGRTIKLLSRLEIPIHGLCDSDKGLWGKNVRGYEVLPIDKWISFCKMEGTMVIIAVNDPESIQEILRMFDSYGLSDIRCYTYFALKTTIELHIDDHRIKESYRKDYNISKEIFSDYMLNDWENRAREYIYSMMQFDTILIWQPGKVGSTSIAKSLEKEGIHYSHLHCLSFVNWLDIKIHNSYGIQHHWENKPIKRSEIIQNSEKVKIISLVRDPIARSIADYFEGLGRLYCKYEDTNVDIFQDINNFIEMEAGVGDSGYIFEWFDHEIKEFLDIDIYQYDFDKEKGYQVISEDNIEILLIKTEKLTSCEEILGQFVGVEGFKLIQDNVGNQKIYKFAYDEVKQKINIPDDIIDFYYNGNKCMDHFYTENEKKEFIKKWGIK